MVSRGKIITKQIYKSLNEEIEKSFGRISVESLRPNQEEIENFNCYRYRVRVPLLHGDGSDSYSIPDDQLPWATYCPLPGSSYTELNVDDLVYVSEVDLNYDDFIIIGLIPKSQMASQSGSSLQRIKFLQTDENASVYLGNNTRIGYGENEITPENLQSLKGFNHQLTTHTWSMQNGGTGVSMNGTEQSKKEVRDNFGIYSTVIINQEDFNKLSNLEKNTIYYIWDD